MTLTIENLPDDLERALRQRAAAEHKSLSATIIDMLGHAVGIESKPVKRRDLSDIAGKGLITAEMEAVFEEQRRIDPELWK